uniref:EGF-like domain-containing protein n=1 Tax=Neovison vison TaxID=452646 RepID=A0A8C7BDQ2_NEOVI
MALHIIHLGDNSKKHFIYSLFLLYIYFLIIISLTFSMFLKDYQKEKHKGKREEIKNATAQKLQQETLNWILNNLGEGNGSMDGWRPQDSSLPPTGVSPRLSCCRNGGTCVLGSFCICPAHFTGRYCEHDQRHSECGALMHGAWTFHSCRLCRCVFAVLHCLPQQTPDSCGKFSAQQGACFPLFLCLPLCLLVISVKQINKIFFFPIYF